MFQSVLTPYSLRSEIKKTFSLGLPLIASNMLYSLSGFIGTAMVARLGQDALAASVLVSMIWFTLTMFFVGILNATSVLVSHQFGARNNQKISQIMGQAFLLGIILTLFLLLILHALPLFLHWSQQPPSVLKLSYQYAHALMWTTPGLIALVIAEQMLGGIGQTKLMLFTSLITVPIEIPLMYGFVFGKFGLPALGISGIGFGLAITYSLSAFGLLLYIHRAEHLKIYNAFSLIFVKNMRYLKELVRVGLPMGLSSVIEISTFAVMSFWIGHFGTTFLAAHQIVIQYASFVFTLIFAMSQAVTIRVGHYVGEKNNKGIRQAIYAGLLSNGILVAMVSSTFIVCPTVILQIDFNIHDPKNALIIKEAIAFLCINAVSLNFDNIRFIIFGALRSLKDTRFCLTIAFISFWIIGLGLAYTFAFIFHAGATGVWWGVAVGIGCGAVILCIRLYFLLRRIDLQKLVA